MIDFHANEWVEYESLLVQDSSSVVDMAETDELQSETIIDIERYLTCRQSHIFDVSGPVIYMRPSQNSLINKCIAFECTLLYHALTIHVTINIHLGINYCLMSFNDDI